MIPATTFKGQAIAVFGLGGSGLATCRSLMAGGATVAAWDDGAGARDNATAAGIPLVDLTSADWTEFSALVLAPGVPLTHPEPHWTVHRAQAAGIEAIGDVEIFCRERRARGGDASFIAITGTNGKSTTTALAAHVLKSAGVDAHVGGNIGVPVLSLPAPGPGRVYVVEMSSYQIDLTPTLDPTIGMLLNITPDHIDRHGTFELYAAVKERLVAASAIALVNLDDPVTAGIANRYAAGPRPMVWPVRVEAASAGDTTRGYAARGETVGLTRADGGPFVSLADAGGIPSLRGRHNLSNAAFVAAAADLIGLDGPSIEAGLKSFPGLPHRMEQVARREAVVFINDSKATNADSADKALAAFERDVFWIAGGLAKEGGIASLAPHFGKIAHAYLVGEAANDFAATLDGRVTFEIVGNIEAAVVAAARDAAACTGPEPVVLLSPACASFDQFRNFELRGDAFRAAVAELDGAVMQERVAL
jgi:UDP-N-acetylmuramoylalanine--D-glutamate ligase